MRTINKFLIIILFYITSHCVHVYSATISDIINPNGTITDLMVDILGHAGIRINGVTEKEDWMPERARITSKRCEDVMQIVQGKNPNYPNVTWFISANKERWEADTTSPVPEKNIHTILEITLKASDATTKRLSMGTATYPKRTHYDGILLLGSTLGDFKSRVHFLKRLIDAKKIIATPASTKIYILTGKRVFNDAEQKMLREKREVTLLKTNNEKEGLSWVFEQEKGNAFAHVTPILVSDDTPTAKRATTESTVRLFIDQQKCAAGKNYLFVSSHVFTLYQYLIIKRVAAESNFQGTIDMCGTSIDTSERGRYPLHQKFNMILDNFARIFYEICTYKKLTGIYPQP